MKWKQEAEDVFCICEYILDTIWIYFLDFVQHVCELFLGLNESERTIDKKFLDGVLSIYII